MVSAFALLLPFPDGSHQLRSSAGGTSTSQLPLPLLAYIALTFALPSLYQSSFSNLPKALEC